MELIDPAKKGNLLIVDDSEAELKVMELLFRKNYNLRTVSSPLMALGLINEGFEPHVIISDETMPEMNGSEFLERTIELVPDAVRVVLTANADPKEIIRILGMSKAYLFLTKPYENVSLLQAIKNCFKEYQSKQAYRKISESHDQELSYMTNMVNDLTHIINEMIPAVIGSVDNYERGYLTNHTNSTINIAQSICSEMDLDSSTSFSIVIAGVLLQNVLKALPNDMISIDPNTLDTQAAKKYFKFYNSKIDEYMAIKSLNKVAGILSHLWEHYDGTGMPVGIDKEKLPTESQILLLASIFHNMVYSIPPEIYRNKEEVNEYIQTPDTTAMRINEAIKYLFKNTNWFNIDIANGFKKLLMRKKCPVLQPENKIYKAYLLPEIEFVVKIDHSDHKGATGKILVPVEKLLKDQKKGKEKESEYHHTKMSITDLQAGLIVTVDIVTKFGRLVIGANTKLTTDHIDEIKSLEKDGLLTGIIEVDVPRTLK